MFLNVNSVFLELLSLLSKVLTGPLLTPDQIKSISKSAVGQYLTDFLPTPESEILAADRVENARLHVEAATRIILEIKEDLDSQRAQLERTIFEIEEKRNLAKHYETLLKSDEETAAAYRKELEDAVQARLTKAQEEGRAARRIASAIFWVVNLIIGAGVGAYYRDIESFARSIVGL
jgi:hypothetical protein